MAKPSSIICRSRARLHHRNSRRGRRYLTSESILTVWSAVLRAPAWVLSSQTRVNLVCVWLNQTNDCAGFNLSDESNEPAWVIAAPGLLHGVALHHVEIGEGVPHHALVGLQHPVCTQHHQYLVKRLWGDKGKEEPTLPSYCETQLKHRDPGLDKQVALQVWFQFEILHFIVSY